MGDPVVSRSGDQICCSLNGEAVVLNIKTGKYFGLNDVGARVWALVQEPRTAPELHRLLLAEFDVDPAVCERDLNHLILDLEQAGLVEIQR